MPDWVRDYVMVHELMHLKRMDHSPKFWKLISRDAKLATIASGFGFTEGPVSDKAGFLYVSDEEINKIFRVYPNGKKEEVIALGDPDGNTFDRRCSEDRHEQHVESLTRQRT